MLDFSIDPKLPVEERNRLFETLSREEKRVEVARHAVALLEAGRIHPSHVTYFNATRPDSEETGEAVPVHSILEDNTDSRCYACVIGSMFAAKTFLTDQWNIEAEDDNLNVGGTGICGDFAGIFSTEELHLLEAAYELNAGNYNRVRTGNHLRGSSAGRAAIAFGSQFDDNAERQIAILNRIIANGGTVDFTESGTGEPEAKTAEPVAV